MHCICLHACLIACLPAGLQVIEVGQVGRLAAAPSDAGAAGAGTATLYAHSQRGGRFGDASGMLAALSAAAQGEAKAAKVRRRQAGRRSSCSTPALLRRWRLASCMLTTAVPAPLAALPCV